MIIEGPNCLGMVNYIDCIPLTFVTTELKRSTGPSHRWKRSAHKWR